MNGIFKKLVLGSLRRHQRGSLTFVLPNGQKEVLGGLGQSARAEIRITDEKFFQRCVLFGAIGFAESYIEGEWETPSLTTVIDWFILNTDDSPVLDLLNLYNRWLHRQRPNSLEKSRANISDHYDLSNDFFKLWLDPSMTYSSGYFDPPEISLQEAQEKKYESLCRKLRLSPGDLVLEIGTGWGGFSIYAARNCGCRITTTTISQQQYDEATARIQQAGLSDRIRVLLSDYRTLTGRFDKIVSIEMIEAVGDRYVEVYFQKCNELLKPDGLLGLQMILCPDRQYPILKDGVDFIQKHIFPGSLLMSVARVNQALVATGDLNLFDYEDMAPHYARTLLEWRRNFEARLPDVLALGFDDRFIRKWTYYLCYCEAAFASRHITVAQAVYSRPDNRRLTSQVYK